MRRLMRRTEKSAAWKQAILVTTCRHDATNSVRKALAALRQLLPLRRGICFPNSRHLSELIILSSGLAIGQKSLMLWSWVEQARASNCDINFLFWMA